MLRRRVITVLTFVEGVLFRTKSFSPDYRYTLKYVDAWSIDEIVVLDVTRTPSKERQQFKDVIGEFAKKCFVPLSVGGGIRVLEDARAYIEVGADKVIVNTGAILSPDLIPSIAKSYGTQCVVASVDVKKNKNDYEVYSHFGAEATGMSPITWAKQLEDSGAGEIMISSIDRDGSLQGYDNDLCRLVSNSVSIPVLICGGAGNWKHFEDGFKLGKADAVCTTNIYHFTETSINSAKKYLSNSGVLVRE
tara:strand:+ start:2363 stop:3106 length:744 start_codon:yes stop_codon:yes gene_type:complete